MADVPVHRFGKACRWSAGTRCSDWNKQTLLEGVGECSPFPSWHCKDHPFSVALRSQSAKLVCTVWTTHSSHSTATELVTALIFTVYPVLAGYWGYSSEQGRTEQHCCHVLGGEKTSFES